MVVVRLRHPGNVNSESTNVARFAVDDQAPDFSATIYDGNKIRLADFMEKPASVRFLLKWTPILGPRFMIENGVLMVKNEPVTGFPLQRTKPWPSGSYVVSTAP